MASVPNGPRPTLFLHVLTQCSRPATWGPRDAFFSLPCVRSKWMLWATPPEHIAWHSLPTSTTLLVQTLLTARLDCSSPPHFLLPSSFPRTPASGLVRLTCQTCAQNPLVYRASPGNRQSFPRPAWPRLLPLGAPCTLAPLANCHSLSQTCQTLGACPPHFSDRNESPHFKSCIFSIVSSCIRHL